jgi:DNA-directed RNA polymerase subunit RPC12/RpoP
MMYRCYDCKEKFLPNEMIRTIGGEHFRCEECDDKIMKKYYMRCPQCSKWISNETTSCEYCQEKITKEDKEKND